MNKQSSDVQLPGDIPENAGEPISRHEARWTTEYDKFVWAKYGTLIEACLRLDDPEIYSSYTDNIDYFIQMIQNGATAFYQDSFDYAAAKSTQRVLEFNDTQLEREADVERLALELETIIRVSDLTPNQAHSYFCDAIEDLYDFPRKWLAIPVEEFRQRLLLIPDLLAGGLLYDRTTLDIEV